MDENQVQTEDAQANNVVWSPDTNAVKPFSQLGRATEQQPSMNRHQRRANVALSIKYKKEQLKNLKTKMDKLQKLVKTINAEAVQELNEQIQPVLDAVIVDGVNTVDVNTVDIVEPVMEDTSVSIQERVDDAGLTIPERRFINDNVSINFG